LEMSQKETFDILVVGAGINGLSTAYHSSRHTKLKIGILEQFSIGNSYGGSHGTSRIFRSTYPNSPYVQLAKRCRNQDWEDLEKDIGHQLIYADPACYFGDGKTFEKYLHVAAKNIDIDILDISSARRLFPQFRFSNISQVLHDRTSGIIAANEMVDRLKTTITKRGVKIYENTKLLTIDTDKDPLHLITNRGIITTKHLVLTAGAWLKAIIPQLNTTITPIKQTVAYFKLQGPSSSYQIPKFPNWAYIGDGINQVFYGLPAFGSPGIKIAQHITTGKQDDPDEIAILPDEKQIMKLRNFVEEHFTQPIDQFINSETCLYANTLTEDFIIDLLPTDQRIAIGAACSGHAFKFAPLVGRVLTELVLYGKTTVSEFEEAKNLFTFRV
jgi:sarcosine oxidase